MLVVFLRICFQLAISGERRIFALNAARHRSETLDTPTMTDTTSLLPVYTAFGGIILGSFLSIVPVYFTEHIRRKLDSKAVTSAIVTEIRVSLLLIEKRRYVQEIGKILADLRDKKITGSTYRVVVPEHYSPVFKTNVAKIGLLPDEIRDDVVMFYHLMEAAICDVRPGGLIAEKLCGEKEFSQLHDIAVNAVGVGQRVVNQYSGRGSDLDRCPQQN